MKHQFRLNKVMKELLFQYFAFYKHYFKYLPTWLHSKFIWKYQWLLFHKIGKWINSSIAVIYTTYKKNILTSHVIIIYIQETLWTTVTAYYWITPSFVSLNHVLSLSIYYGVSVLLLLKLRMPNNLIYRKLKQQFAKVFIFFFHY